MQNEIEVAKAMRKKGSSVEVSGKTAQFNEEYREKMMKSSASISYRRLKIIEIIPKHTESNATAKKKMVVEKVKPRGMRSPKKVQTLFHCQRNKCKQLQLQRTRLRHRHRRL